MGEKLLSQFWEFDLFLPRRDAVSMAILYFHLWNCKLTPKFLSQIEESFVTHAKLMIIQK